MKWKETDYDVVSGHSYYEPVCTKDGMMNARCYQYNSKHCKVREQGSDTENRSKLIAILDALKRDTPEQVLVMETPKGTVSLKIGDALVYEDPHGWVVIDSE